MLASLLLNEPRGGIPPKFKTGRLGDGLYLGMNGCVINVNKKRRDTAHKVVEAIKKLELLPTVKVELEALLPTYQGLKVSKSGKKRKQKRIDYDKLACDVGLMERILERMVTEVEQEEETALLMLLMELD